MRILIAHSRYLSGPASGENRVVDDEAKLLSEAGHEVHVWDPEPEGLDGIRLATTAASAVWNRAATATLTRHVRRFRPDVVHFHNLFPALSPAVLRVPERERVASVMTLHNYRLLCLPATFLRQGRSCEDCLGKVPWRGVVHRCYRGSAPASAAYAASLTLHRALRSFDAVNLYLAVSSFVANKHVEAGFERSRIRVKANFAFEIPAAEPPPGDYFLFLGRLSAEKGARVLLDAWNEAPGRLLIVGDGPEEESLRAAAGDRVEFRGSVPPRQAMELLRRARAVLVPSQSYEGAPRTIVEAAAAGVPVVASRMAGPQEAVEEGISGIFAEPHDPADWSRAVQELMDDDLWASLAAGARRAWTRRFSPRVCLEVLEATYREAVETQAGNQ